MPRKELRCVLTSCRRRIEKGQRKIRLGQPDIQTGLTQYCQKIGLNRVDFAPDSYICSKCHYECTKAVLHEKKNTSGYQSWELETHDENGTFDALVVGPVVSNPEVVVSRSHSSTTASTSQSSVTTSQVSTSQSSISTFNSSTTSQLSTSESSSLQSSESQAFETQEIKADVLVQLDGIQVVNRSSDRKCFVCQDDTALSRSRVPNEVIKNLVATYNLLVPSTNRCCPHHIQNLRFTTEAVSLISQLPSNNFVNLNCLNHWIERMSKCSRPLPRFDFTAGDVNYKLLTGLTETNFKDLFSEISPYLRNSCNRSKENALGCLLMLFRTAQTQEMLGYQLDMDQPTVSDTIDSVSTALLEHFVPTYLGFKHLSREEYFQKHSRQTCNESLGIPSDAMVVVIDGTYIYRDKPTNFEEQRKSYSGQKKRNFDRYAMICLPSGYCLEVVGPFTANTNDADCLAEILKDEDFNAFLGEKAYFILDRGYENAKPVIEAHGHIAFLPSFLGKNQSQFTVQQANNSRCVTNNRWVVESKNGKKLAYKY